MIRLFFIRLNYFYLIKHNTQNVIYIACLGNSFEQKAVPQKKKAVLQKKILFWINFIKLDYNYIKKLKLF